MALRGQVFPIYKKSVGKQFSLKKSVGNQFSVKSVGKQFSVKKSVGKQFSVYGVRIFNVIQSQCCRMVAQGGSSQFVDFCACWLNEISEMLNRSEFFIKPIDKIGS